MEMILLELINNEHGLVGTGWRMFTIRKWKGELSKRNYIYVGKFCLERIYMFC